MTISNLINQAWKKEEEGKRKELPSNGANAHRVLQYKWRPHHDSHNYYPLYKVNADLLYHLDEEQSLGVIIGRSYSALIVNL